MTASFFSISPLLADDISTNGGNKQVVSINVTGNHFIETAAIMDKIRSKVGQKIDKRRISRDVRRLFATGFFADISVLGVVKKDGRHLTYHVKENPMIASLTLDGLHAVKEKDLKLKLKLKPGRIFNKPDLDRDIRTIRRGYLKKGFYQIEVDALRKPRDDGRVDVTLKVHEGDITRIKRVRFIGNESFSNSELAKTIASRQSGLMAWFKDRDVFNRDRLKADRQLILQRYLNQGYLDAKVESTLVSLSSDKRSFYITFSIHEGTQYEVSSIKLEGDIVPDRDTLMDLVHLHVGELYSLEKMRNSINDITIRVGDEGYAFATVTPLFQRNIDAHTVGLTFDIEKGKEVYIERIEISGNNKTVDKVIRRELRQQEGARFSSTKLEDSKKRLKRLSLFEDVRVSMPKGSAPDKVRMKVEIDEKSTGSFTIGAGFSQLEKVFVRSSINERNFLGKGYNARVSGEVGARTQNIDASMTDPFFLDKNLSASINVFKRQTRFQSFTFFKENSFGGGFGIGIPITDHFSYGINYQFSNTDIFDIPANSSLILQSQAGKQTTGELTQSLTWDTRDSIITPKEGSFLSGSVGIAGAGGINKFVQSSITGGSFFAMGDNFTLNPSFSVRYIHGYSNRAVPIFRRFSMGGIGSVRGFDQYGVTIRDPVTGEVIGGNKTARASVNLFFPLPYMQTAGFRGLTFADIGSVADFDNTLTLATARASVGFGIEWLSPIGPVGLVWGFALRKQPDDITKTFEFALGSTF
ncbi:MAG: outer membrane protein assembly factor BamA [Mariprofundaceae bacterium]|nr:outer membrane protein assembly factor BamA [Mariprofundaceae bacterium]